MNETNPKTPPRLRDLAISTGALLAGALLAATLTTSCSAEVGVRESTTVEIPPEGGVITSADGLFSVHIAAGSSAEEVSIETLHGQAVLGLTSLVYEVSAPAGLRASEVFYDALSLQAPHTKVLVTVDDGTPELLSTYWDLTNQRLLAAGVSLERRRFAVLELGFRHGDCANRTCGASCTYCEPGSETCVPQEGACDLGGICVENQALAACGDPLDGWDDAPGTGRAFVINSFALAGPGRGFDIDGECDANGCIDNELWPLGTLMNDQIRQGLLGGESLLLLEFAGLDDPYRGDDGSLTFKMYTARDADDPFFPANNYRIPPGHTECCKFLVEPRSLIGLPPQARARAPARVERGRLRSLANSALPLWRLPLPTEFPYPEPMTMERGLMGGRLTAGLEELTEGLMGGAFTLGMLASQVNPYCRTVNPRCANPLADTMLDLVITLVGPRPDVDFDGDGLECVLDSDGDGLIDRCCDGEGSADACGRCTNVVPPLTPERPQSCAFDPRMADGYSLAVEFTAVAAEIVGVSE